MAAQHKVTEEVIAIARDYAAGLVAGVLDAMINASVKHGLDYVPLATVVAAKERVAELMKQEVSRG